MAIRVILTVRDQPLEMISGTARKLIVDMIELGYYQYPTRLELVYCGE